MYSDLTAYPRWIYSLTLAVIVFLASQFKVVAEELNRAYLRIKPSQCVSLRQNQDCYSQLSIQWQARQQGDYCLYSEQQQNAIFCWENSQKGQLQTEMKINGDTQFWLKAKNSQKIIAQTQIKHAWVHKKQRLSFSSWRVF